MHDLRAQVTSSLLPFPRVTVDALGEDEITLDSVLHGKFTVGRGGVAWLACGPHLEVVHAVTAERLSAYCFSGGGENPPSVLAARDFSWLKRCGLLVGLEETEGSVLCLYDLGLSRVVKAVVIPGRITAIEPLVSYGGASVSTQHLHQSLRWFFGIAAVVTDLGHVLLVDLCLDDLSCSQTELEASDLQVVTKSPADIPRLREISSSRGRHLCLQLNAASGVRVSALQFISRTNQLAVGFSDGVLQLWNMKTLKKEYQSQLEGGRVPVYAFTFQEPENDPRNCCYLWAVQSSQDLEGDVVSLRLLQMAFSERKCLSSGNILYEGLEYCEERYSQDLSAPAFPRRNHVTSTQLLSCQTIEKFRPHPDRDDSMNEVASPDTSVSIFSWQVKAYGQGTPSTFIGVFDINRWYHAQMPDSLRSGESLQNCPYLAVWSLDPVVHMVSDHVLTDVLVHERSLSRGLPYTWPPPEQYFNPTTYNFDATCLFNAGIVHLTCSGYQKETLNFLKKAAPCSSDVISSSYSRCLMAGLLSSRLADTQASSLSQEEQLDAVLSTAVETSSLGLITGCIKQWTSEEQPGSALNLRYILDWAWNKVIHTKDELDAICAPLFDSSSNFTDPQTLQLLQHIHRLLSNLSTIFQCLLNEAQELTQRGLVGLINKNLVSSLISKYCQVVLWFCRTGLLPEGSDEDALQISRPFYSHSVISSYYTIRREELSRLAKGKWSSDCLMIDGLVSQCGQRLTDLWKRDEGGTGTYPPPTLHALLDIYLLEDIDESTKHAIVIYLLLDVMYSFPNKEGSSVESFPPAFSIPIGLVKLVQGLWLLDHHDHQSSFELLLHPAASQCVFSWQHERVLQALMVQGQHSVALRYFHVTKPPVSSTLQAKLYLSVLLHNRCLVEAWSLLRQHSNRLNTAELLDFLYESCQDLDLIKDLLKLPLAHSEQESLEKFLQGTGGLHNRELLMVHYLQQANYIPALQLNHSLKINLVNERDSKLKERSNTRNSILDQYGKVLPRVQRKLAMERSKPYQHPYAVHREVSRPQPLSTITRRSVSDRVVSRAAFISNVLTKIQEVWFDKEATPPTSPVQSSWSSDVQTSKSSSLALSEPFLGTPITSRRKSRLLDLVVHPSYQTPGGVLSPPRPSSCWLSTKSSSSKAPELSLLQTPQVVKRARALAASGPVFSAFTPQSILRSSLRPTPVATPSASPGRSVTPPLRSKESRITFIEEAETPGPEKGIRWTNGTAADSEISLLTRGSLLSKTWTSRPEEEEEVQEEEQQEEEPGVKFLSPSPLLRLSSSVPEVRDSSLVSVPSADTTMEFYDARLPDTSLEEQEVQDEEEDDGVVTVNIKLPEEQQEEQLLLSSSSTQPPPLLTSEEVQEEQVEDDTIEDLVDRGLQVETKEEEEEEEEDPTTPHQTETLSHDPVRVQVSEDLDSGPQDPPEGQEVQTQTMETTMEFLQPEEELEQSTDLTEFVQKHLFGSDPPLTRSGIHDASHIQSSFNSESQCEDECQTEAEAPRQQSPASVSSSEPTATDSHSVVSVIDSEEISSPVSEEEEEEEEEDEEEESDQAEEEEEEEEEDSGSEVEIIEEVQGNGSLPSLQPTSVFVQQQTHFLSEQEAAEFSLISPGADMKVVSSDLQVVSSDLQVVSSDLQVVSSDLQVVSSDLQAEVVMVRLGADEEEMDEGQGSSYMELKPSTTLLVPLEIMEDQTPSSLSLMLDLDQDQDGEGGGGGDDDGLQPSDQLTLTPGEEVIQDLVDKPELILLDQDPGVPEEDQRLEVLDGSGLEVQTEPELAEDREINPEGEKDEAEEPGDAEELVFGEDHEPRSLSEPTPAEPQTLTEDQKPEGSSESGPAGESPQETLTEDQEPEGLAAPSPGENLPVVMLTEDPEPEESGPGLLGETEDQQEDLSLSEPPVDELPSLTLSEDLEPEALARSGPGQNLPVEPEDLEPGPGEDLPVVVMTEVLEPEDVSQSSPGENVPPETLTEDLEPGPGENLPVEPEDLEPGPGENLPVEPEDLEPGPGENLPVEPEDLEPGPGENLPVEPEDLEPGPVEDLPVEPEDLEPGPVEDLPVVVMETEDPEPEGLTVSGPTPDHELPPGKEDKDAAEEKEEIQEEEEEEKPRPKEEEPAENGPVVMEETPSTETNVQQEHKEEEEVVMETVTEPKRRSRGRPRKLKPVKEEEPEEPQTKTTRRTTREKNVTFTFEEEPEVKPEEPEVRPEEPTSDSSSRTPRKQNKKSLPVTPPRRSARNVQPETPKDDDAIDAELPKSPGRRRTTQRSSRTSQEVEDHEEEEEEEEVKEAKVSRRSRTSVPAKRRSTQASTPRRTSRRLGSSIEVSSVPLEVLEEEKEQEEEVLATPAKRNARRSRMESQTEKKENSPSRSSNRITLSVYPQGVQKPTVPEHIRDPELSTRSRLWEAPVEEFPLLDSPLEVDSETPVADALIRRLQTEEDKEEVGGIVFTKMLRTSRRSLRSSLLPVKDHLDPEPEESDPDQNSFIYSPSRRKTPAKRAESPGPSEESEARVTRSRRRAARDTTPRDEEDVVDVEKAAGDSKSRKAGKKTAKSRTVLEAEAVLLSPLPSPADLRPPARRRNPDSEAPPSGFNLRRKRILDAVFTKPVVRRKKL